MDFALAREIYGHSPWMMDPFSFSSLFNILKDFRAGVSLEFDPKNKLNSSFLIDVDSRTKIVEEEFELNRLDEEAQVIAVIRMDGPITKNGGASSFGTKQISERMSRMTKDPRVLGHIIVSDSGGGASNAIIFMKDAILESRSAGKPVVQLIEKGGMSASAMFGIGSFSNFIFSETRDNLVGSIGTMIELAGFPKQHTEEDGLVHVRVYATASFEKNIEFEEAIEGNLEPIITNLLNPINEKFIADIRANRPNITDDQVTGKIFKAGDVVGTLIDGIGNMEDAVNKVLELSASSLEVVGVQEIEPKAQVPTLNKNSTNLNKKEMDIAKFKQEHPEVYAEVFQAGIDSEKDRVGSWMAHSNTDMKSVQDGIDSGKEISKTQREEFLIKSVSLSHVKNLQDDSSGKLKTKESKSGEEEETEEVDQFYKNVDEKLKTLKAS